MSKKNRSLTEKDEHANKEVERVENGGEILAKNYMERVKELDDNNCMSETNNKRKVKGVWKRRAREQGEKVDSQTGLSPSKRMLRSVVNRNEEERVNKK